MGDRDTSNRLRYRAVDLPNGARSEVWFKRRGGQVEWNVVTKHSQGSGSGTVNWARCSHDACLGEAIEGGACFEHSSPQLRQNYLKQVRERARPLSLKGTKISQQLWDEIVASPVFEDGRPVVPMSLFGAEIIARIRFVEREFDHFVELSGATVFESMEYHRCKFKAGLTAHHVHFDAGPASFHQCNFKGDVDVSYSQVDRVSLGFERCTFERSLTADGFSGGGLILSGSTVNGAASFKNSRSHLILNGAGFSDTLDLLDADCIGVNAEGLALLTANRLGPFAAGSLLLARATFGSRILIEVRTDSLDLSSAAFDAGGLIVAERAKIHLEQVRLGGPLRVSGTMGSNDKPQVLSLRNADAGKMSFAHVDLSRCSFQGAHGLGSIELESSVSFASAPWWAGGRRFIADEYAWRSCAGRMHQVGWKLPDVHVGPSLPARTKGPSQPILLQPLEADQVASIYRELRRSLEAKSDMPGAADFYYGEMEMRRWSGGRPFFERILVWCYWLTSGYGLRPGRAFVAWLLLVFIGAWSLCHFGYASPPSVQDSILAAIRATIPGFPTQTSLTVEGQWIETGLRVFGAIFIALFFLAARSMVMRKPSE